MRLDPGDRVIDGLRRKGTVVEHPTYTAVLWDGRTRPVRVLPEFLEKIEEEAPKKKGKSKKGKKK